MRVTEGELRELISEIESPEVGASDKEAILDCLRSILSRGSGASEEERGMKAYALTRIVLDDWFRETELGHRVRMFSYWYQKYGLVKARAARRW